MIIFALDKSDHLKRKQSLGQLCDKLLRHYKAITDETSEAETSNLKRLKDKLERKICSVSRKNINSKKV